MSGGPPPRTSEVAEDGLLERVAHRLGGIDAALLKRIVDVDDDGLHLVVQRRSLEAARRPAMRQLSLLSVALRQAGGTEDWTPVQTLRDVCQDFGVYEARHFSEELRSIAGLRARGSGSDCQVKATVTTFEQAGELVERLTGLSSADKL